MKAVYLILACLALASAEVYYKEQFEGDWESRWVKSTNWKKDNEMGSWKQTPGKWYGDENDNGIQTQDDHRFYGISTDIGKSFNNEGKTLVLQYSVKFEESPECGGAYIKVLPSGLDQESFGGDSDYSIMFGPDVCGSGTRKTHIIFNYKGKNLLMKSNAPVETDELTHLYTLIINPDNTYEFRIDNEEKKKGSLFDDWDFLPPKMIKDPKAKKPSDWVDEEEIPDPEDKKPEGYDDIPANIPDPDAKKPEDWNDEDDGEWEAPMIPNPEYKGEWKPKMIKNPDYKGKWVHPEIENPDYVEDNTVYNVCKDCQFVGFELWQVKAKSLFDDIIITDSIEEAEAFAKETFFKKKEAEKAMHDKQEEEKNKASEEEAKNSENKDEEDEEKDED